MLPPLSHSHPNYDSIVQDDEVLTEDSLPNRVTPRFRKIALFGIAVFLYLFSVLMWSPVGSSVTNSYLFGPLLGPYIEENHRHRLKRAIEDLRELDEMIEGSVIFMNDDAFCDASHVWKEGLQPPLAVVEALSEADAQLAVPVLANIYLQRGVPFRIRSGGHSYGGYSNVQKGIILSLSGLNSLTLDETTGVVTIGPAVKVQDLLDQILVPHGFGGVVGECPGVAEGGFALGGGLGFLSRKYGLGLDNILAARVVLSDGSVIEASESLEPDLFWALRGAGQNMFGVVTQLEYQLHPSQDTQLIVSGELPLDASMLVALGEKYLEAPGEFMFLLEGIVTDDGTTDALVTWFGEDEKSLDVGEAYIRENLLPLVPSKPKTKLSFDRSSWAELTRESGNFPGNLVRAWTGYLFEENNTVDVWSYIIKKLKSICIGNPYLLVDIELWGGAIANKEPSDTAFFWRKPVYNVGLILLVPANTKHADRMFDDSVLRVDEVWSHIYDKFLEGVYPNYVVESLSYEDYSKAYWGDNLKKLRRLKQTYDPENVFHHPQSVLPAGDRQTSW
jgi:FAD/FMN-containing dehydrogenase